MRFRKHLASLHSKMKIWPKRGGVFVQEYVVRAIFDQIDYYSGNFNENL